MLLLGNATGAMLNMGERLLLWRYMLNLDRKEIIVL